MANATVSDQQLNLAIVGFTSAPVEPAATIQERYEAWRDANPWVLDNLEILADDRVSRGVSRFGVKALVERLRWDWTGERVNEDWLINNSFTSRLARDLIDRRPDLAGFIELRQLRAA